MRSDSQGVWPLADKDLIQSHGLVFYIFEIRSIMQWLFTFIYRSLRNLPYILVFWLIAIGHADEKPMVIVIPSYNNVKWYQRNLDSVLQQNYDNFRVIYIDDASTDGTDTQVAQYLSANDANKRVTFIRNDKRLGALANIYRAVWMCDPADIIVTVDGDDWLYNSWVLKKLDQVYANQNIWMTYGQFIEYPTRKLGGGQAVPFQVIKEGSFRKAPWMTTHLRTFYAGLFHKIRTEDFLFEGEFYQVAWDLAFMFPMLEMAASHSQFISQILYVYNVATPLSDFKLNLEQQRHIDQVIRNKKPYEPIPYLMEAY